MKEKGWRMKRVQVRRSKKVGIRRLKEEVWRMKIRVIRLKGKTWRIN